MFFSPQLGSFVLIFSRTDVRTNISSCFKAGELTFTYKQLFSTTIFDVSL